MTNELSKSYSFRYELSIRKIRQPFFSPIKGKPQTAAVVPLVSQDQSLIRNIVSQET